ncbi:MAG TPA: MaoC/PaaZ C-terminal domain-containing protein [Chloroflexota bacterium]|nr:MaoC/PaaZ C-terminal domain-containing protein [Chloroflexota bacterium]HUM70615.1 MaoC/PaaZ C-terminal domain-containing protein [Chloroflexota bacterium]
MRRGLTYEEFELGAIYDTQARTVTEADVVAFAGLSGDFNPLHTDAEAARNTPFGERIAHGMLTVAMATGMANMTGLMAGTTIALMEQNIQYKGAVKFGDTVRLQMEVIEKRETSKPDRGIVKLAAKVLNQRDELVVDMVWTQLMKRQEAEN